MVSCQMKPKLEANDIVFFYNLLFRMERNSHYKGYNIQKIPLEIKKAIILNGNFGKNDTVPHPHKKNMMNFTGKRKKTEHLLRHIRNSFAHGFTVRKGETFVFHDQIRGKTTMEGNIDVVLFYKLIKSIEATRL